MANPNRTAAEFRRRNPRPASPKAPDEEMRAVMDAVGRGDMTPADGARRVAEMMEERRNG